MNIKKWLFRWLIYWPSRPLVAVRDRFYARYPYAGLDALNFICQFFFGINAGAPWPVHYTSRVTHPHRIRIGRNVARSFARSGGCYIQAENGIEIGDDTLWGPGVKIISANHDPNDLTKPLPAPPIAIGKRCWIGANVVILPGVQLGDEVIVGAGAVVTKSFPSRVVIAGNPARIIRHLDGPEAVR